MPTAGAPEWSLWLALSINLVAIWTSDELLSGVANDRDIDRVGR